MNFIKHYSCIDSFLFTFNLSARSIQLCCRISISFNQISNAGTNEEVWASAVHRTVRQEWKSEILELFGVKVNSQVRKTRVIIDSRSSPFNETPPVYKKLAKAMEVSDGMIESVSVISSDAITEVFKDRVIKHKLPWSHF